MTEQHGKFMQFVFLFDPNLDPIRDNVKSFVVLKSLKDSDKPKSLDEIKEMCSGRYKIELSSEELSDIIDKWYECISCKNGDITLTKKGRNLMQFTETKSEEIQKNGFEWFKEEMFKWFKGKMFKSEDKEKKIENNDDKFQDFKEKIENNEDKLQDFFIKCVSRASKRDINILKGMSGVADSPLIDATICKRRLESDTKFTEFDKNIKESFYSVIDKLFETPSDERINRFMYALQYTSLIRFVLPGADVIDMLKNDLANKKFCLDSNAILSALFQQDYNHYLIYDTFSKLKRFNDGHLPIFWHKKTDEIVMDVLEASKRFCKNMEFFPEDAISDISLMASKSPVKEYFKENWPDWRSFEKYYIYRYKQLKSYDRRIKKNEENVTNIAIADDRIKEIKNGLRDYLQNAYGKVIKSEKVIAHDAMLLEWIYLLRRKDTSEPITPNYWIVTMDKALIGFEKDNRKELFSLEDYPLCVSKRALHLLLDPYFMANTTKIEEIFDKAELGISATMKKINVNPFYTIKRLNEIFNSGPNEQKRLIGDFLDKENLNDLNIKYMETK
jgi:hypothetical protein